MSDETPELTVETWQPKAELFGMVHRALTQMAHTWPKAFTILNSKSEASREFVTNYCFALRFVDWRAVQPATREWVATQKFAPKPAEFAALARAVSDKHFPRFRDHQSAQPKSIYAGVEVFWFASPGREKGYARLNAEHGIYFKLRNGDLIGIGATEFEEVQKKTRASGPLNHREVPEISAPAEFFEVNKVQGAA